MANIPEEKNPVPQMAETPIKASNAAQQERKRSLHLKTLNFAIEFGFIIALPLVAFAYLGKFLDRHYQTNNEIFLLAGIILALITSSLLFYRRIKDIMKDMQK